MLQQFSWTTFLIAFALLSALWYLMLALTIYRKEVLSFIFSSGAGARPIAQDLPDQVPQESRNIENQIMGKAIMPEGLEIVSMGALNFSVAEDGTNSSGDAKSDQLGLVPDVLQELKEIFAVLAKEDGTKQDFFSLAAMISEKYGRIGSSPNIGRINEFIREQAPFAVTMQELENLWD